MQTKPLITNRSLGRFILFSIITLGIYPFVYGYTIGRDLNTINSRYDNKKTMNYVFMLLLSPFALGIPALVWQHRASNRVGFALRHRSIMYDFSSNTFWLWAVIGSIIVIGPFVYIHKLSNAMNYICKDYNTRGFQ